MSVSGQRICELAQEAADAPSPEAALDAVKQLRAELAEFERQQVARALTAGRTLSAIAKAMGISRQAVHSRFCDLGRRRRGQGDGLSPTPEVRLAFEYAQAEARALDAPALGPEHVVLGILRAGDRRAARALTSAGVELDDARGAARAAAVVSPPDVLRSVLADAVRYAKQEGVRSIEAAHVLRAALAGMDDPQTRLGVTPERVVAGLDAVPGDCVEA